MILPLLLGTVGFIFYIIYDINSYTIRNRLLGCGFFVGSILIAAATVIQFVYSWKNGAFSGPFDTVLLVLGILSFALLIYCLFFALPFEETYIDSIKGRRVCDQGVYASCRHPGWLCFFTTYLFFGLAALPTPFLLNGMIYSLLNLLYVIFQDLITFPKIFYDYTEYRNKVPFIIPTKKSIRLAINTLRRTDRKEDSK